MKILKKSKERTAEDNRALRDGVTAIIDDVCQRGDTALHEYNEKFDDCHRQMLRISREEIEEAYEQITEQEYKSTHVTHLKREGPKVTQTYSRSDGSHHQSKVTVKAFVVLVVH